MYIYLKERRVCFQEFVYQKKKKKEKKNKAEPQDKFLHVVRNHDFQFIQPISFRMTRTSQITVSKR